MDKTAFFKISYGLYIISARADGKNNGQIVNTVFQVSAEPPLIAVSVNKENYTHEFIEKSGKFSITVLSEETPMSFIGKFGFKSGRDIDKFEGINYELSERDIPLVLENAVACFELDLINKVDVSTHTLFIGKVIDAKIVSSSSKPMTYSYYHEIKQGLSPKKAPTYVEEVKKPNKGGNKMKKYRCTVCGYIYDPEKGDPDGGIAMGTPFEEIPDDWVCPICGVGKDQFEEVAE